MRSIKLPSWIEAAVGFAPRPAPPHVFAIDDEAVRYACVDTSQRLREGVRPAIDRAIEVELPHQCFLEGPLGGPAREPQLLRDTIAAVVERARAADISAETEQERLPASLVLPDRWLRAVLTEDQVLPRSGTERQEALEWKLRSLVPFRVDELRVRAVPVDAVADYKAQIILGFAIDLLLSQLESAFDAAGVNIGRINNESLSLANLVVPEIERDDVSLVALVRPQDYTLLLLYGTSPILYRHKAISPGVDHEVLGGLVRRELALTRGFLEQRASQTVINRAFVSATGEQSALWAEWMRDSLGCDAATLVEGAGRDVEPWQLAPMVGTACEEVR